MIDDHQANIIKARDKNSPKAEKAVKAQAAIHNYKLDKLKAEKMLSFPSARRNDANGKDSQLESQNRTEQRQGFSLEND